MKDFTLYVQASANSVTTLKYVKRNIGRIMDAGVYITVCKVATGDVELADKLRRGNITQLPALSTGTRVVIGSEKISEFFERNLGKIGGKGQARAKRPQDEFSHHDYLAAELYRGVKKTGRDLTPNDGEEELDSEDNINGFQSRMAEMERRRKNRMDEEEDGGQRGNGRRVGGGNGGRSQRKAPPGASSRGQQRDSQGGGFDVTDQEYDDDFDPRDRRGGSRDSGNYSDIVADDAVDQQMMNAFMDNNPDGQGI